MNPIHVFNSDIIMHSLLSDTANNCGSGDFKNTNITIQCGDLNKLNFHNNIQHGSC